jgi:hypothetical protein
MMSFYQKTPERLVYWYLRINGFLQLEYFVIHPDLGTQQRTEADILAVRFKYRQELQINPMHDDPVISECLTLCNVIIAEVKRGQCTLNGPWTNRGDENTHRILMAIGCFDKSVIKKAADALYEKGQYQDDFVNCRLFAFGDKHGELSIPGVPQVFFNDGLQFIHSPFREYSRQKSSVSNWPKDEHILKQLADAYRDFSQFKQEARRLFSLSFKEQADGR